MRLSVRENDPGYNWEEATKCNVFVDGENITDICFTADEELGIAYVYKLNSEGKKYYDPRIDEAAWETLRGKVKILLDGIMSISPEDLIRLGLKEDDLDN